MLEEIQNIRNRKLICLDFDDCLIPWMDRKSYIDNPIERTLLETEKNCLIVKKFIKQTAFEPFITSSWAAQLDNNLKLKVDSWGPVHEQLLAILKQHFNFIGKDPFNDRILAIEILLENGNQVIAVDDLDLSHYFDHLENFKMINTFNGIGLQEKLNKILKEEQEWLKIQKKKESATSDK